MEDHFRHDPSVESRESDGKYSGAVELLRIPVIIGRKSNEASGDESIHAVSFFDAY